MKSHDPSHKPIAPLQVAFLMSGITYFLTAMVAEKTFSSPALARFPAIIIALVTTLVLVGLLSRRFGPQIDYEILRESGNRAEIAARFLAARESAREAFHRATPWWHHPLSVVIGFAYGLALSLSLLWLFS